MRRSPCAIAAGRITLSGQQKKSLTVRKAGNRSKEVRQPAELPPPRHGSRAMGPPQDRFEAEARARGPSDAGFTEQRCVRHTGDVAHLQIDLRPPATRDWPRVW